MVAILTFFLLVAVVLGVVACGGNGVPDVAIRVSPLPEGYEEFDARNGGWAYVDAGQLVVYGAGIE